MLGERNSLVSGQDQIVLSEKFCYSSVRVYIYIYIYMEKSGKKSNCMKMYSDEKTRLQRMFLFSEVIAKINVSGFRSSSECN